MGNSPRHSRKIALALSLSTGHVSPQFHCVFDDLFDTRKRSSGNPSTPSMWQSKAGFVQAGDQVNDDDFVAESVRPDPPMRDNPRREEVAPSGNEEATFDHLSTDRTETLVADDPDEARRTVRPQQPDVEAEV